MHVDYKAGNKLYIDFTESKLQIIHLKTSCNIEFFVAILN